MAPSEAVVSPPLAPVRSSRRHLRRLLLELVPVGVLATAALPSVADESILEAIGSLGSMVAWCLLPALLLLHFLVRSEPGHLVGLVALTGLVVYLLSIGDIEEPLGGLILLQLAIWGPVLTLIVVVGDAIVTWGLRAPFCKGVDVSDFVTPGGIRVDPVSLEWTAVRSGGPGGQHANTSETAVTLVLDVTAAGLEPALRDRLLARLGETVTSRSADTRSQWRNRQLAWQRLAARLDAAATPPRPRTATTPTRASRERRLADKRRRGELKRSRSGPIDDP